MTAGEARLIVLRRDQFTCIARKLDPDAGPCFDRWGKPFDGHSRTGERLEVDRIGEAAGSRSASHLKPETMVATCPGHHRGTGPNHGRVWATANRNLLRAYLAGVNDRAVA